MGMDIKLIVYINEPILRDKVASERKAAVGKHTALGLLL